MKTRTTSVPQLPISLSRRGTAYVLAVVLLALFSTMAVALASETTGNMRKAQNQIHGQAAQLNAESGMAYLAHTLKRVTGVGSNMTPQQVLDAVGAQLPALIGPANLNGQNIVVAPGASVDVPFIALDARGGGFNGRIDIHGGALRVRVVGADQVLQLAAAGVSAVRNVRMEFGVSSSHFPGFRYGLQSQSKINFTGNARITGADGDPNNADIFSGTYSYDEALKMTGNCRIDGDVSLASLAAYASLTGNIYIGGESLAGGHIGDHIYIGVGEQEFPKADPSVFAPFAVNIVDSSTSTSGNKTFTNIRIAAGTNPTFSGNITLRGVVFVETPNVVKFTGNLNMTGVIVTQDAGGGSLDQNSLQFTGNSTFHGVDNLPDDPQYAGLKALPGTFLLAPGFSATFTGNFGTIGGAIAANEFKWTGNAGGLVAGSVINWGDTTFQMTGNSNLTIRRDTGTQAPPGFMTAPKLLPVPASYEETGGA